MNLIKKNNELKFLKRKWIKNSSKENKIKYYKILFLWNMWYDETEVMNNHFNKTLRFNWISSTVTLKDYIKRIHLNTNVDMEHAEKILINNNWSLEKSIIQIINEKW